MEDWIEDGAADGFNLVPPVLPEMLDVFISEVVPLLRRRPWQYYGPTTASDNEFDRTTRLMEIEVLIHENRDEIIEGLNGKSSEQIKRDLHELESALRHAQELFKLTARERHQECCGLAVVEAILIACA